MRTLNEVIAKPSAYDSLRNYVGETDVPDFYVLLTQNRDSDTLTRSNFISALNKLGGESDNVRIDRFRHWACGWWEALSVKCATPEYETAKQIEESIANYPVVDESHWSELKCTEAQDYWASMSIRERVEICQRFKVSVFAARHDYIPGDTTDPSGSVYEYLTN